LLEGDEVGGVFHYTEQASIAFWGSAKWTQSFLGQHAALFALPNLLQGGQQGVAQAFTTSTVAQHEMQDHALG
jgi:hypothetical protein